MAEVKTKKWEPVNFAFYLSLVKWPALIVIAAELVLRLTLTALFEGLSLDRIDLFAWLIRLVGFAFIGWKIGQAYGEVPPLGAIAGAVAGAVIGLGAALLRFQSGFRTWKIFNLITEPVAVIFVGALAVFVIVYAWDFLPQQVRNYRPAWPHKAWLAIRSKIKK